MNTFKTPKGTELPFLNLKGKDYLQVPHRIVWFREDHPDWFIETKIVEITKESALFIAFIHNGDKTLSMAHGFQLSASFPAYIEKAESKAIGRALGFLGYGTAYAQELEEDSHDVSQFADSPLAKKTEKPNITNTAGLTNPLGSKWVDTINTVATVVGSGTRASEAQLKMLYAVSKQFGWSDVQRHSLYASYGVNKPEEMRYDLVNTLKKELEQGPPL